MTRTTNNKASILISTLFAFAATSLVSAALIGSASAEPTKLKLVLNWKYQGPQGMFFLADDKGYFKDEGLEVTLDQGNGSGAPIGLVANGTYDVGFGDINALIELAAKKPDEAPIAVFVMFNQPPFTVAVKSGSPIKTPKDFEGKTLGGAAGDGALKLFPALCKLAKFDCAKVNITNMQPNLREQMLMQGQVDGVFGYVNTIRFSARLMGVDDSQIRYINYGDYGMDLYSNAIIVSKKLVKDNPKAVAGLVRAINRGLLELAEGHRRSGRCGRQARAADQGAGRKGSLRRDPAIRDEPSRDRQDRPRQCRSGTAEEVDRHPGRRQRPAAHARGQRNLHAGVPAGRERPRQEAVLGVNGGSRRWPWTSISRGASP